MNKKDSNRAELKNWYEVIPKKYLTKQHNPNFKIHGLKIPFRMLIVGNSGAGKTQTLLNIMHNMNGTFNNIFIITKNKHEPLYEYIEDKLSKDGLKIVEGIEHAPNLEKDIDKEDQTLIVMDDLVLEKNQAALEEYFIRARKLNCSLIYISQSYYRVPRIIRQNLNYLIIKQVSSLKDLYRILAEYTLGVDKSVLQQLYNKATQEKQDFLLVDLDASPQSRFRKNFNDVFEIDNDSLD
jgi:ABC-type dipeptide/oligopeptide/nickel transport system ATPase component